MLHLLVTGGCGFIGSNFIHYLLETDLEVSVINLDQLTYAGNLANLKDWIDDRVAVNLQHDSRLGVTPEARKSCLEPVRTDRQVGQHI